ncbi:MAG: hypothetical protein IJ583_11630 [Firmicutes bacterium]|nr:hypothetical protein [Bacillota bacterium]
MSENDVIYADDLTDFDENGNVIPSETSIRQAEFTEKLIKDIKSGNVKIDMSEEVFDPESETYYPKWQEDDNFIYVLDEITFTYLPLIEIN